MAAWISIRDDQWMRAGRGRAAGAITAVLSLLFFAAIAGLAWRLLHIDGGLLGQLDSTSSVIGALLAALLAPLSVAGSIDGIRQARAPSTPTVSERMDDLRAELAGRVRKQMVNDPAMSRARQALLVTVWWSSAGGLAARVGAA